MKKCYDDLEKMKKIICVNKDLFAYILLITSVAAVYSTVVNHDFLYQWDDQWVVINHYTTGGLNWENLYRIFTDFYHGQYAPLNEMNYLLIHTFWGYNPVPFHLVSLLWHVANVCLAYGFVKGLLKVGTTLPVTKITQIAFLTAFVWAVHPVNVESVAWISASKVLIYTFFYLLCLLCYLRYIESKKNKYFIAVLLFFLFSFWGKEQAVTLPLCLLLIDYWAGRDLRSKDVWMEKICFFALALLGGVVTILSQGVHSNILPYSFVYRILFACYALMEYFVKAVLPVNLSYLYPFPVLPSEAIPLRLWFYPVFIGVGAALLYYFRKNKVLVFSILFLVIHVAVTLHIISLARFAIVADRYLYLGEIGISFLLMYAFIWQKNRCSGWKKYALFLAVGSYVGYLAAYSYSYTRTWKDTDSVKRHVRELLQQRNDLPSTEKVKELMRENFLNN